MLFNSYEFIFVFLPVVYLGWIFILNRFGRAASFTFLVIGSFVFYAYWKWEYLVLIIASILINFFIGELLAKKHEKIETKKFLLIIGIAFNLGLLGYYKYFNFFVENLNTFLNTSIHVETIFLPLAISFFTFQQIAYLVDAYQGKTSEYDFNHYLLFISFFPQLIAGPIVHHKEMMPQFMAQFRARIFDENFTKGLVWFSLGLFKKVAIADTLAMYATPVFSAADQGEAVGFFDAWIGVLAYSFQLYFDFSGYSDMAIGLALLFGITLPLNFNSPYKSTSIIDFWRRWHMTLSRFLRDYLYIPLGGSYKGKVRRYINLFITMLLGGLWHGASWNFVIWGGLHGAYLICNHFWRRFNLFGAHSENKGYRAISILVTFICVAFAWVVFRAETLEGAINIYNGMLGMPAMLSSDIGTIAALVNAERAVMVLIPSVVIAFLLPNTRQIVAGMWQNMEKASHTCLLLYAALVSCAFVISITLMNRVSEFLYFQF